MLNDESRRPISGSAQSPMACCRIQSTLAAVAFCMILPVSWGQRNSPSTASSVLQEQGANLAQSGRIAEAEVPLLQAAQEDPDNLAVMTELAKVEGRLGKKTKAIALFRRAVAMKSSDPNLRLDLALALADNDQSDEALAQIST